MKRIISLFVVAILVCSSFIPLPVTADQAESITSFVAMSPDQYEELVYLLTNGSDEDKQFAVDYIYDYYNGNTSAYSWDQNYSVALPDGTSELYGFVTYNDYFGHMSIRTVVPATMRGTPQYGYTWYTVDSDAATSLRPVLTSSTPP